MMMTNQFSMLSADSAGGPESWLGLQIYLS